MLKPAADAADGFSWKDPAIVAAGLTSGAGLIGNLTQPTAETAFSQTQAGMELAAQAAMDRLNAEIAANQANSTASIEAQLAAAREAAAAKVKAAKIAAAANALNTQGQLVTERGQLGLAGRKYGADLIQSAIKERIARETEKGQMGQQGYQSAADFVGLMKGR